MSRSASKKIPPKDPKKISVKQPASDNQSTKDAVVDEVRAGVSSAARKAKESLDIAVEGVVREAKELAEELRKRPDDDGPKRQTTSKTGHAGARRRRAPASGAKRSRR